MVLGMDPSLRSAGHNEACAQNRCAARKVQGTGYFSGGHEKGQPVELPKGF